MSISNVIKFNETDVPSWTTDDEGKVLSIKEDKLAWVEMNGTPVEPEIEEYKWIILPNKYTIYNEEGTVLKTENKTLNEWEAPISGDYVIQLHAAGGKGGNTYAKYVSNGASYPMTQYTVTGATGGGGGGSGAKITLTLNKGTNHTLSVSNSKASFDNYYVNKGTDGENGNINTVTGGKGGAYGTYANGMTLLAKAGEDGGASTKTSALSYNYYSEGGDRGDGSALKDANDTGAYGNGGSAGSFLGGSLTGGEGEENEAEGKTSNLGPAIIIRRKLE